MKTQKTKSTIYNSMRLLVVLVIFFTLAVALVLSARLPVVSGDGDAWGTILNAFLVVSHTEDGSINTTTNATFNDDVQVTKNLTVDGNVSANFYHGDISKATGINLTLVNKTTATIIVASRTAKVPFADFIADGINDEVQIEAAFAALPASGGTVYLTEGQFNIAATINLNIDNVALIGSGAATILNLSLNDEGLVIGTNVDNILVKDLRITGAGTADSGAGSNEGIEIRGGSGIILENIGIGTPGFRQAAITVGTFSGNFPDHIMIRGIYTIGTDIVFSDIIHLESGQFITIENSVFHNMEDSAIDLSGSSVVSFLSDVTITGNIFGEPKTAVFAAIDGNDKFNSRINIVGNIFFDVREGILIRGEDIIISDNIIKGDPIGNGDRAIGTLTSCSGCIISNNRIFNFEEQAISLVGMTNGMISNNLINDSATGIDLDSTSNNNLIIGNSFGDGVTTTIIDAGSNNKIINNVESISGAIVTRTQINFTYGNMTFGSSVNTVNQTWYDKDGVSWRCGVDTLGIITCS